MRRLLLLLALNLCAEYSQAALFSTSEAKDLKSAAAYHEQQVKPVVEAMAALQNADPKRRALEEEYRQKLAHYVHLQKLVTDSLAKRIRAGSIEALKKKLPKTLKPKIEHVELVSEYVSIKGVFAGSQKRRVKICDAEPSLGHKTFSILLLQRTGALQDFRSSYSYCEAE